MSAIVVRPKSVLPSETAIRLTLSSSSARKLAKTKGLKPIRKGRVRHEELRRLHFDTPRHVLRKAGLSLALPDLGESEGSLIDRIQDPDLVRTLSRRRCSGRLHPVFRTEVNRTVLRLRSSGAEIHMAIDEGTIESTASLTNRTEAICEAELQLVSGDSIPMLDLALDICEAFDARPAHRSQEERGYALARPSLRPKSMKARPLPLSEDLGAGDAFRLIVSSALDHLFHNEVPTFLGSPGGVHQARVAMRRLRAVLRAFKGMLPYEERKAFNSEFRWLQQRLAPARDWHVFLDETIPLIAAAEPRAEANLMRLRRLARAERRRATDEAIEHLQSRRYARLILRFQKWLAGLENAIPSKVYHQPILPFALRVLRRTQRDLLRDGRPLARMPTEDLHDLRKRGKKTRYATEFFSTLWVGDDVKPYLKLMSRLQDKLGYANDASVARQILWSVRPGRLDPTLVRLVQDWSEDRIHECIHTAQPHWRRLRKATPFWES